MRGSYKGYLIHSLNSYDGLTFRLSLEDLHPTNPRDFEMTLDFYAAPEDSKGADAFFLTVCSPNRFFKKYSAGQVVMHAQHTVFMRQYDGPALVQYLKGICSLAEGETWTAIAVQINRVGRWEFDYKLR